MIAVVASVAALGKVPFRHWRVLVGVADVAEIAAVANVAALGMGKVFCCGCGWRGGFL